MYAEFLIECCEFRLLARNECIQSISASSFPDKFDLSMLKRSGRCVFSDTFPDLCSDNSGADTLLDDTLVDQTEHPRDDAPTDTEDAPDIVSEPQQDLEYSITPTVVDDDVECEKFAENNSTVPPNAI